MRRREFLFSLAAACPGRTTSDHGAFGVREELPSARAITREPGYHWRGYYDKLLFDPGNRFILANEVDFEGRSPRPDDVVRVGMVDTREGDRWIELGMTRAWNWQQGCMLQWLPGAQSDVIWNDREGDHFVCHILNVTTGKRRTLPSPVYCLSPDGRWGLVTDFRRLNDMRPGYGYAGLQDPNAGKLAPADAGIWRVDLHTGAQTLLFSLADAAGIPFSGRPENAIRPDSKHWFNHLLFNTDGSRFLFLHRWRGPGDRTFSTRMFTANPDGGDLYVLDPWGMTSHFVWRDPHHVMAWAWHPSHGDRFYLFRDRSDTVEVVGKDVMTVNGHNTYVPGTNNEWVLNDTYPDGNRIQHLYLFHIPTGRRTYLGHFASPPQYAGEWRCDLHPCASRDGRCVVIDSAHGSNGRQLYLLEIGELTRPSDRQHMFAQPAIETMCGSVPGRIGGPHE